jgi:hypothetical protein
MGFLYFLYRNTLKIWLWLKSKTKFSMCFGIFAMSTLLILMTACEKEKPHNEKVQAIDQEIDELNQQLTSYRLKEMNLEIQSQGMMFEEWKDYTSQLQKAEEDEHAYQKIEKRIQQLQIQREALLKKPT